MAKGHWLHLPPQHWGLRTMAKATVGFQFPFSAWILKDPPATGSVLQPCESRVPAPIPQTANTQYTETYSRNAWKARNNPLHTKGSTSFSAKEMKFRTYQKISVSRKEIPTSDAPTTTILVLMHTLDSSTSLRFVWFKEYFSCKKICKT